MRAGPLKVKEEHLIYQLVPPLFVMNDARF